MLGIETVAFDEDKAVGSERCGEAFAEECGKAAVDLGGDDGDAAGEEFVGEDAGAGADFENDVVRGERGGVDEFADEVVVDEEVLAKSVAGGEAAGFEDGFDFGEGLQGVLPHRRGRLCHPIQRADPKGYHSPERTRSMAVATPSS